MKSRFIILQTILGAGIVALYFLGLASRPFAGNSAILCAGILAAGLIGLICVFLERWNDAEWIATHVVRLGLLGTVLGLIAAFGQAALGGGNDPAAVRATIAGVVNGMYVSLYATLLGIGVNLWLKVNLKLLGGSNAEG